MPLSTSVPLGAGAGRKTRGCCRAAHLDLSTAQPPSFTSDALSILLLCTFQRLQSNRLGQNKDWGTWLWSCMHYSWTPACLGVFGADHHAWLVPRSSAKLRLVCIQCCKQDVKKSLAQSMAKAQKPALKFQCFGGKVEMWSLLPPPFSL